MLTYADVCSQQIGYPALGWLFRLLPAGLQRTLTLGSAQCWYYMNLVEIGTRGEPEMR
jgi:hypothetical protein